MFRNACFAFIALLLFVLPVSAQETDSNHKNQADQERQTNGSSPRDLAVKMVEKAPIPANVQQAMVTVIRQHEETTHWLGKSDDFLFSVIIEKRGTKTIRLSLWQTQSELFINLLTSKSALDFFRGKRLDDLTTLKSALLRCQSELRITGETRGILWKTQAIGNYTAGYAYCDQSLLVATLESPENYDQICEAYRLTAQAIARRMMTQQKWGEALKFWFHLHDRKLVSESLYLDAAECFIKLKRNAEAKQVLEELWDTYRDSRNDSMFERMGDLFMQINCESQANNAYDMVLKLLQ